jgi:hypothetical protein
MKLFSYVYCAMIAVPLSVACGSADEGAARDANASTPPPAASGGGGGGGKAAEPGTFCSRTCIAADQARCEAWAADYSDAFLSAFETCGDNPACITPLLEAAPVNERQQAFAKAYCAPCTDVSTPSCVDDFWKPDGPGDTLRWLSDARLDAVEAECLPELAKNAGSMMASTLCGLSFSTCKLRTMKLDATVICRQAR